MIKKTALVPSLSQSRRTLSCDLWTNGRAKAHNLREDAAAFYGAALEASHNDRDSGVERWCRERRISAVNFTIP